jgi:superfamily II RNA helicase
MNTEFVSIFAINVSNLTSAEAIKLKKVEENSKIYITYLDEYLKTLDLSENEDLLVSNYYNNVKMLPDASLRNSYYNQIILKVLTELKKSEIELEKLNKRFAQKNDQIRKIELDIIRIKNVFVQFYLYLKNHEKVKTFNPIITDYISSSPINWTSYQIENLSTNLIPNWNFKEDKFRLEPIQNEALMNIDLKKNILLSAPTSWGKTLLSTYGIFNNNTIIYVVPTKPTAQQLAGMIASTQLEREKLAGTIRKNIRLEIELLSYKRFASEDNIIVATPKELYSMIKKQDIPSKIDYVILDEFHNIAYNNGEYYEYILNYAGFNKIPTMCLSATIPNFDEVSAMLKSVLHGDIHEINEHRRFYNVKRYGIYNKDMKLLNPLEWLTKDSIRSPLTHYIGLEPKVALDFYKKIPDLPPINETAQKFVSLDDIHKMECEGFKKLKDPSADENNMISMIPL